jgi:hypothetical protein
MSRPPMSEYLTSGLSCIFIIDIAASVSGGKMSTTACEERWIATRAFGFKSSRFKVERTLT